jgi:hypothetical protein
MVVVLRDPEPLVAQRFGVLRERDGIANGLAMRAVGDGDRLIENGKAQRSALLAAEIRHPARA